MYTLHNTVKISDLRKKTAEVIEEVAESSEPVYVFSRSQPKVVMMSWLLFAKRNPKQKEKKISVSEKHGIDFFIDPPEDFIIKKKGLDAVKLIRAERE